MMPVMHQVYLNLGSDIEPFPNIERALDLLGLFGSLNLISTAWETLPVGTTGQNFINIAVSYQTTFDIAALKTEVIHPIEEKLGRVRTQDKYAPRPIDIDIMLFDSSLCEPDIWKRPHLALPLAELLPDLLDDSGQKTLKMAALSLHEKEWAEPHPEFSYPNK